MKVRSWLLGDKEATDGILTEKREKSLLLFSIHKSPMGTLNVQDENKSACPQYVCTNCTIMYNSSVSWDFKDSSHQDDNNNYNDKYKVLIIILNLWE